MFSAVAKPFISPSPPLFRLPLSSISISFCVFPSFISSSSYSSLLPPPQSSNPIMPLFSSSRNYSRNVFLVDQYLSCSMPEKPLRVAALLSGGVNNSVALRLLHAAGHSCTTFYLKILFQEVFENFWNQCPWEDDLKYAKHVCEQVDVPLEVMHLTDEYWKRFVSYIIEEYHCVRTPNPDVLCYTIIKLEVFENFWNQCPWEDDLKYTKHVCEQVDVPLEVVHLTNEYWEKVVSYIIEEYHCVRTPNPDVLCNTIIKFGKLFC